MSWYKRHQWTAEAVALAVFCFYTYFNEVAAVYWQFGTGGTTLLGKFRRLVEFFIYVHNYAGGWLEFHFMVHALPGGLVI